MGRPRKWASDAERKRAARAGSEPSEQSERVTIPADAASRASEERTAASVVLDPPVEDGPDLDPGAEELIDWEGKLWPVVRTKYVSEDEYASAEVQITKDLIAKGLKDPDGERVSRTERYARWRYRGWLVGEIRSL